MECERKLNRRTSEGRSTLAAAVASGTSLECTLVRLKPLAALSLLTAATFALTAAGGAGAADGTGLTPIDPDGPGAEGIQDIYWLLLGIAFAASTWPSLNLA